MKFVYCIATAVLLAAVVNAMPAHSEKKESEVKISPFMKKHGLRPGHGWGSKAGLFAADSVESDATKFGILQGLFIRPCIFIGTLNGQPVSVFDTRHYADDRTYNIDRTYYIGDENCTPLNSDVYYKTNFYGTVSYHGGSEKYPQAAQATLDWSDSILYFSDSYDGEQAVKSLKENCNCDVKWKLDEYITVNETQCHGITPETHNTELCMIIAGLPMYFLYEWTDQWHYATSRESFEEIPGWSNPVSPDYVREKIPEYGNDDPADCTIDLWDKCSPGIDNAARLCETCTALECDGCLFRELNPNWNATIRDDNQNNWYLCCPCIHEYANLYEKAWIHTLC